jgi:Tfp pilus assembly protein PilF
MNRLVLLFAVVALILAGWACSRPLERGPLAAGVAAAEEGRWDDAVRSWTEAAERDPGSAAAHNNLAVALEKKGDWDAAGREYEAALRLEPASAEIKANYGSFKLRLEAARKKGS